MLVGGIVASFCSANFAVVLLRQIGVAGFKAMDDIGSMVLATLGFHGAVILSGIFFLRFHGITWREVFGLETSSWQRPLGLAAGALLAVLPVMFGLKYVSELLLQKVGWPLNDQHAVEAILNAKSAGLRVYIGFFAVVIAPLAEEFFFRGLLFSAAKKIGWPKCGWVVVSLLFAAIHSSAPVFLPLFIFALLLTWLYQKTEGLLAPIAAHAAFNAINVIILLSHPR